MDKIAIITNQSPQNIHDIMHNRGFELEFLPLYWLPQNTTEYENKTEAEQTQIDKDYTYIMNSYLYDSGNCSWLGLKLLIFNFQQTMVQFVGSSIIDVMTEKGQW